MRSSEKSTESEKPYVGGDKTLEIIANSLWDFTELKKLKTEIINYIDALRQLISHIEESKNQGKFENDESKAQIKNLPSENPIGFTEYLGRQKEENESYLGLFFELPEANKFF